MAELIVFDTTGKTRLMFGGSIDWGDRIKEVTKKAAAAGGGSGVYDG